MESKQPPIKIIGANGTIINITNVKSDAPNYSYLENLSGMKFGKRNVLTRTLNMITKIRLDGKVTEQTLIGILLEAESILVDYFKKNYSIFLGYNSVKSELVIYVVKDRKRSYRSVFMLTQYLLAMLIGGEVILEDFFFDAELETNSLIENLKYFEKAAVEKEKYDEAAALRDLVEMAKHYKAKTGDTEFGNAA